MSGMEAIETTFGKNIYHVSMSLFLKIFVMS